jgi:mannose-6-phosphate isomerase-like protein (cupin superfamily)
MKSSPLRAAHDGRSTVITKVNLQEKVEAIAEPWSPVDVAWVNDQVVRLAMIQGEYHWHKHTNEDELFYVLQGRVIIQLKDQTDVALGKGEMAVVPKGVGHCPRSEAPSYILMFEPHALVSRGD